ncbi:MAG: glutamyl-tRNA reductase [Candidatus Adiutrix sp.]|jgi:glutamyl-tRNA reductase|nr:glutamyl-tRNA reductase [Candidatus Adiutrix sp.]
MDFLIVGVSHQRAPLDIREKFSGRDNLEELLYQIQVGDGVLNELLILSTCNRLEILAAGQRAEEVRRAIVGSLAAISGLAEEDFGPYSHEFRGLEAAHHLFRVAASLDSLVLGEPQILGQVKEAYRRALDHRRAGLLVTKLMHRCFRAAKRVRSETTLAGGTVSVAGAAVALARNLSGGRLSESSTLLLGAGPMAALAAANLKKNPPARLTVMNRSQDRARLLAAKHGAAVRPWEELEEALAEADLVIAATGAPHPILTSERLAEIQPGRADRPLIIIDIGVPRNVAHDVKRLPNLILRNIDDLNEVVWESRISRQEAADRAEAIIGEEVAKFAHWLESLVSQPTVSALTRKAESIRRLELERTLSQHQFSPEQAASLEAMTSALVRRLLHDPLVFIKSHQPDDEPACPGAGESCRPHGRCLDSLRRAFKLEPGRSPHGQ